MVDLLTPPATYATMVHDPLLRLLQPPEVTDAVWTVLCASMTGDAETLRRAVADDPHLVQSGYWYTQPLHVAVREGHAEAVRVLLDAGADPTSFRYAGEDLTVVARDRGHEVVALLLEDERRKRHGRVEPDHAIHRAAAAGKTETVRAMLGADPGIAQVHNANGATPLHLAVMGGHVATATALLDGGADANAVAGHVGSYAPAHATPIDLALWKAPPAQRRALGDLLLARGAIHSVTVAAARGDGDRVLALLDGDPTLVDHQQACGRRALSTAIEHGQREIAKLLLTRGASPNAREGDDAPRGAALWHAARLGDEELVRLLLASGADPNATLESSGTPTYIAKSEPLRELLIAHGGTFDQFTLAYMGRVADVARLIDTHGPAGVDGGALYTATITNANWELFYMLVERGVRVPASVTNCQSYLWATPAMTRILLERGMDPTLPSWQRATPLHHLCSRDGRGRTDPRAAELIGLFLDHGADIEAVDEEYRSTPLGWAARSGQTNLVELLLARGAKAEPAVDEPWATPLSWALRRGHGEITALLRRHGARR